MKYYKCHNCGSVTAGYMNNCPDCNTTHTEITEDEYVNYLEKNMSLFINDMISDDVDKDINDAVFDRQRFTNDQIIRNCRTVISGLVEKMWEMGGYTLGENEFENLSVVKDARDQLKEIEEYLK